MAGRLFFCLFRRHLGVDGVVDEAILTLSLRGGLVGDPLPLALGNDDADKIICFFIVARGRFLLRIRIYHALTSCLYYCKYEAECIIQ